MCAQGPTWRVMGSIGEAPRLCPRPFTGPGQRRGECVVTPALWEPALPCQPLPGDTRYGGVALWSLGELALDQERGREGEAACGGGRGGNLSPAFLSRLWKADSLLSTVSHRHCTRGMQPQTAALPPRHAQPAAFGLGGLGSPSLPSMAVTPVNSH